MKENNFERFKNLDFEGFRKLAQDPSLSPYEKIGFPNSYREGKEESIFLDIVRKTTNLQKKKQLVVDIGPGCSGLPLMLIDWCRDHENELLLIDSKEMLDQLPDEKFITKVSGYYPRDCRLLFEKYGGKVDVILAYSIFHYVFAEGNIFDFIDSSLMLIAHGGVMLLGDIPNISKRKRFFSSPGGIKFHQQFTGTDEIPEVHFNTIEPGQIDDSVLLSILQRCRNAGYDAYWLPQAADLPMWNRREDLLIFKP